MATSSRVPIFPRQQEARELLRHYSSGPTNVPCFVYSPPEWGKSTFLINDVAREALRVGYVPIYIDLQEDPDHPEEVLRQGIARAIVYVEKSTGSIGARAWDVFKRLLNSDVENIELEVAKLRFGIRDSSGESVRKVLASGAEETPGLMRSLAERARSKDQKILLVIDHLDLVSKSMAISLNSALSQHRISGEISACFALGSRDALVQIVAGKGAPFQSHNDIYRLRELDERFVLHMKYAVLVPRGILIADDDLIDAFDELRRQPSDFMRLIERLTQQAVPDLSGALDQVTARERNPSSRITFARQWSLLSPLEKLILRNVATGRSPDSETSRRYYSGRLGQDQPVPSISVRSCVSRLIDIGLLHQAEPDQLSFRNPSMLRWARGKGPFESIVHDATTEEPDIVDAEGQSLAEPAPADWLG